MGNRITGTRGKTQMPVATSFPALTPASEPVVSPAASGVSEMHDSAEPAPEQNAASGGEPTLGHDFSRISVLRPQAKLAVSQPGDPAENEAEQMADTVMRMEAPEPVAAPGLGAQHGTASLARQAESVTPMLEDAAPAVEHGLQGGGQVLDRETRAFMEPRFSHDFSRVRIHTDARASESAEAVAARAYTVGSDIAFHSGEYNPGTSEGRRLLAHELTHVVQQSGDPATPSSAQRTVAVTERQSSSNQVQRGIWDTIGDWLDLRDNEEQRDEWEDYQEAKSDLSNFRGASHEARNFQSTTRIGLFDALYDAAGGTLQTNVKCKFNFVSGDAADYPTASAADLTWTDQKAMDDWKARFISTISGAWSGNHTFYCQKPWWESLRARVAVNTSAVDADEHFALTITKIPTGAFRTSSVTSPTMLPIFGPMRGSGDFDSNDLDPTPKPGGTQIPAVHEAGHMLGLDDEYGTGTPEHSDLVQSEFGHGVARGSDGRIMSGGSDIQPEHGVTFLEALKEATDMQEWTATLCPLPRAIPSPPPGTAGDAPGDYPLPKPLLPGDPVLA